jgi:dinuclear metal center YbgI/SA1388 family protein
MRSPHTDHVDRSQLLAALDGLLQPQLFRDHGPNGLQVEGRQRIHTLVTGVTASLALIEAAIDTGADAVLVHHGLFWRGQDGRVTGWMRQRLGRLLAHDINLLAYHLPLDAHPRLGNNAQLAHRLSVRVPDAPAGRFGDQALGFLGEREPGTLAALVATVQTSLGRTPTVVGDPARQVRCVALCTGGAQGFFEAAIAAGADVFITGEISEPQAHYARETGVAYIACGHHASERYGVAALGEHVAGQFGLAHHFIDIDNPA